MSLEKLRNDALTIFHAGLEAGDPVSAVIKYLKRQDQKLKAGEQAYDLSAYDGVYVIGMGKAAAAMAQAVEEILGNRLNGGVVNVKYGHALPLNVIKVNEAGHPVPDRAGLKGTEEIIDLLQKTGERDLVICLISGGGSALLPCPAEGLTLEDKQGVTKLLLECGARIHEINAVRKHISRVKGGKLARLACPSTLISLILSDVIGDNLDTIASGPTVPDESTYTDCLNILKKYGIKEKVPGTVLKVLAGESRGELEETPKADDPAFRRTQNVVIGSNILAVKAARQKAHELGYNTLILSSFIEGETKDVAKVHTAIAKEILSSGNPIEKPACIISGGETTVTVRGKGLGGRNQEFALASAIDIDGLEGTMILSGGTDGTDGPTDAAGALANTTTVRRASSMGLEAELYLDNNDSYNFFKPLGDLIITGPTRTNVMDLRLVLVA
ncbi:MAG TPA: glycerate kinase [Thermodesulfobacteriota bacterium]|nr:glycerate kinase [Thermodesulfobacteriota bacterium]